MIEETRDVGRAAALHRAYLSAYAIFKSFVSAGFI